MGRRIGQNHEEPNNEGLQSSPANITETLSPSEPKFNYGDQQAEIQASLDQSKDEIDKLIADNAMNATDNSVDSGIDNPYAPAPENDPTVGYMAEDQPIMTLHDKELYEGRGFDPAIEIKRKGREEFEDTKAERENLNTVAASGIATTRTTRKINANKTVQVAKPATTVDLENIDESMIMNMPQIKAASFEIIDILNPKPKDPAIRFKWANYKNAVQGNLGRLKSLGFQVAHIDDIDMGRSHIDDSMIDGTQIKYYDVILMKIGTIRLMSLYKSNIIKSISKLARVKEKGIANAKRMFDEDISGIPGASTAYRKMKEALGGKEPVQFFDPGNS